MHPFEHILIRAPCGSISAYDDIANLFTAHAAVGQIFHAHPSMLDSKHGDKTGVLFRESAILLVSH